MFYNILKYWPSYKEPPKIIDQYLKNDKLRDELRSYWKLDENIINNFTNVKVYTVVSSKSRIKEKTKSIQKLDIDNVFDKISYNSNFSSNFGSETNSNFGSENIHDANVKIYTVMSSEYGIKESNKFVSNCCLNDVFDNCSENYSEKYSENCSENCSENYSENYSNNSNDSLGSIFENIAGDIDEVISYNPLIDRLNQNQRIELIFDNIDREIGKLQIDLEYAELDDVSLYKH